MLKERLLKFIKSQGLTVSGFESKVGLSNGSVSRTNDNMRRRTADAISMAFPLLNIQWLLTGEGEMLESGSNLPDAGVRVSGNQVPLIPVPALVNSLAEYIGDGVYVDRCERVDSPIPGAEFAIQISGDSMEPRFQDGAYIFLKRINEAAFIPWGNPLVVDTENGVFLKVIFPCTEDDNLIVAKSLNSYYPDLLIPKDSVRAMFRVLGTAKIFTTM